VTVADSVASLLEATAERMPDADAVVADHESVTYGELRERAAALARRIESVTRPHEPVGMLVSPSVDAVVALHAIARSGRVAVVLDESAPRSVTSTFMRYAGARVALTEEGPEVGDGLPSIIDGAAVYFTSGSTGAPKAFVVSDEAQLQLARSCAQGYGLQPGEHAALLFHHSFGAARVSLLGAAASGATLHVYDARRIPPDELAHRLEDDRVSFAHCSPSLMRAMLSSLGAGRDLPALRLLATGADALGVGDVEQFRTQVWSGCVLAHTYATSETGPIAAFFIEADTRIEPPIVPVGRPLPGKHVVVEDADERGIGQILVGGVGLASGYLRNRADTAASFRQDGSGAEVFCTGDRGRLRADGMLEHHGRRQNVVKVRGFTIDRDEVERAVRALDPIREATVQFQSEPRRRLVAYLVSDRDPPPSITAIREELSTRLATHLIPAAFVFLEHLPRDDRGKVDNDALPPVPTSRPALAVPFVPADDDLQCAIAQAFESVLGIAPVGIHDDFFELGGDSLAAAEVAAAIRATTGRELTTAAFLEASNVAALRALLNRTSDELLLNPIVTINAVGGRPPFVCVHDGSGAVLAFGALAATLDRDRPFHALQLEGVPVGRMSSVRRLAAHYVSCLMRERLGPPLALGGFSFGATTAFEMARRLARAGERPELLVLIDPRRGEQHASHDGIQLRVKRRAYWARERVRLASRGARANVLPPHVRFTMTRQINEHYHPGSYEGDVFLITTESAARARAEWESLVRGRLDIVTMAADHSAVIRAPFVDELARHIEHAFALYGL
jgi:acyl-coenzyme A synthetase/AMP-(fatty) acid ligase/thioesterase domain-containing protein